MIEAVYIHRAQKNQLKSPAVPPYGEIFPLHSQPKGSTLYLLSNMVLALYVDQSPQRDDNLTEGGKTNI